MISHTVYRDRSNAIALQLLAEELPLEAPDSIARVEISIDTGDESLPQVVADTDTSPHLEYDDEDGVFTAMFGRVDDIKALPDGVYQVEVTGYGDGDSVGTAFGSFAIYLRDWGAAEAGS